MGLPPMMQVICSKKLEPRCYSPVLAVVMPQSKAREVLELATIGGAKVLGRDELSCPLACPQIEH